METTPHVLVVDDHREIREPLARYLERHGLRVTAAESAAAARRALKAAAVDLVVLDIMMPGEDGLALCRSLRETTRIPVILLTAMGEETDRIVGLEVGADDYVSKPFNPARAARAHQGRWSGARGACRPSASRCPPGRTASGAGRSMPLGASWSTRRAWWTALSAGEFRLLVALLERPGMVLLARPAPRPHPGPGRGALRPRGGQPGEPPAAQGRARPQAPGADRHRVGRRLSLSPAKSSADETRAEEPRGPAHAAAPARAHRRAGRRRRPVRLGAHRGAARCAPRQRRRARGEDRMVGCHFAMELEAPVAISLGGAGVVAERGEGDVAATVAGTVAQRALGVVWEPKQPGRGLLHRREDVVTDDVEEADVAAGAPKRRRRRHPRPSPAGAKAGNVDCRDGPARRLRSRRAAGGAD